MTNVLKIMNCDRCELWNRGETSKKNFGLTHFSFSFCKKMKKSMLLLSRVGFIILLYSTFLFLFSFSTYLVTFVM